jgi:hypothetical protein
MTAQIIPVDPDNACTLARYANDIRALRKQVSSDIIEIGRMLIESKFLNLKIGEKTFQAFCALIF